MKRCLVIAGFFLMAIAHAYSQSAELLVKSNDKSLYVDHKVQAKENFYSIGRLYNVSAKDIAAYNKLDMTKGLNLGQVVRIPLTANNFSQTGNSGTPVFYKVGEKEALAKVSSVSNGVSLDNLRRWNNLTNDHPNPGSKLIVGFLISNEMPAVTIAEKKEVVTPPKVEPKKEEVKKAVVAKTEPVTIPEKVPTTVDNTPLKKVENTTSKEIASNNVTDLGYFKTSFDQQVRMKPVSKNEILTSGIFKTASGWQDAKYYLLMDGIQPGTVVKITNPENNKAVYAKVLGEMSGIRQNEGLNIRISNSAASVLEVGDPEKFTVKVIY